MSRSRLGILLVCLLTFVAGCGESESGDSGAETPEAALGEFVDAMRSGDAAAACERIGEAALEDLEVAGSCEEVMGTGFDLLVEKDVEVPDYEIVDVSVDGEHAEATLRSEATEDVVPLVREGGEWKLEGATALSQIHPDSPLG